MADVGGWGRLLTLCPYVCPPTFVEKVNLWSFTKYIKCNVLAQVLN